MITQEDIRLALEGRHGQKIQERLSAARVAIAGLGGLGSNVAVALARTGVGHLQLIDFDRVDITNLNRQQYFIEHIGMYKTDALSAVLERINPYLDITQHCVRVTDQNIISLFREADIVCEAFDNPEAKAMLVNGVLENYPEKMLVAASGMAGYGDGNAIHTRKITEHFYLCGDEITEPDSGKGLMAPRVALCAAHQANQIIRLILQGTENEYKGGDENDR